MTASQFKQGALQLVLEMRSTLSAMNRGEITAVAACSLYRQQYSPRLDPMLRVVAMYLPREHGSIKLDPESTLAGLKYSVHKIACSTPIPELVGAQMATVADQLERDLRYVP